MTKKTLPTPETLRQLLRYEPDTGKLFWRTADPSMFQDGAYSAERKCKAWNGKYSGKQALDYRDKERPYPYGDVFGVKCYAHRAIIAITEGYWPEEVDHINGDKTDNRLVNLRAVTRLENMKNTSRRSDNTSGYTGISYDGERRLWAAEIISEGKKKHLGRFASKSQAAAARLAAERKYGFHPNHGRNSCTD